MVRTPRPPSQDAWRSWVFPARRPHFRAGYGKAKSHLGVRYMLIVWNRMRVEVEVEVEAESVAEAVVGVTGNLVLYVAVDERLLRQQPGS